MKLKRLLTLLFATVSVSGISQVLPEEKKALSDALFLNNLTLNDLNFTRRMQSEKLGLSFVYGAISRPLEASDKLLHLHHEAGVLMPSQLIGLARQELLGDPSEMRLPISYKISEVPSEIPLAVKPFVASYAKALAQANSYVYVALKGLTAEEKRTLIDSLPLLCADDPRGKFSFTQHKCSDWAVVRELLERTNLPLIRRAAEVLAMTVERDLPAFASAAKHVDWKGEARFRYGEITVCVLGVGEATHQTADQLVINLGGKKRFEGREGAGVLSAGLLIDLGTNSIYSQRDIGAGAGLMGIGLAYCMGAHPTFSAKSVAQGAGIGGVGLLYKTDTNSTLQGDRLCQGFGAFGIGAIVDEGGNDQFSARSHSQGSASVMGVGWLISRSGDDTYRLTVGQGQGYAAGQSRDNLNLGGGIGMLSDLKGNDTYIAQTLAQASATSFGLASLYDEDGNDTYVANSRSQAYASNQGSAYLFELAGDDKYVLGIGEGHSHAIGHSMAMFLDRAGNDLYAGKASNPAYAADGSLALFLDCSGKDHYEGPPAVGGNSSSVDALAVFVDGDGGDQFRVGLEDSAASVTPATGIAIDFGSKDNHIVAGQATWRPTGVPGGIPLPSAVDLNRLYDQGANAEATEEQRNAALSSYFSYGLPAFKWLLAEKLSSASQEGDAFIGRLAQFLGAEACDALALELVDRDDQKAAQALRICTDFSIQQAAPLVAGTFARPALLPLGVRAAGVFDNHETVPQLMALAGGTDHVLALYAVQSLAAIADPVSLTTGQSLLNSPDYPVREAALQLVAKTQGAMDVAKLLLQDPDERHARNGVRILGLIGSPDALDLVGASLSHTLSGVRIQALIALHGRVPAKYSAKVKELKQDPSPLVRAIAAGFKG